MAVQIGRVQADGCNVFYRHAGPQDAKAPTVLLLHGYPTSSFMFRNLIPLLAAKGYRVIAPDLPGFGFTEVPLERAYPYKFAALATTAGAFADALGLARFAVYVFDYGAPTGFRLALERPAAVAAVVTQNGNAYAEGLGRPFWDALDTYWATADREPLRQTLELATTKWQYEVGQPEPASIPPEAYHLDQALMDRPGNKEVQLDLYYDYRTNVALYPRFHDYLRTSRVPVLAAWGRNDPIFVPAGAEAFRRDAAHLELHFLDAGHFALETNEAQMAELMHGFFEKYGVFKQEKA